MQVHAGADHPDIHFREGVPLSADYHSDHLWLLRHGSHRWFHDQHSEERQLVLKAHGWAHLPKCQESSQIPPTLTLVLPRTDLRLLHVPVPWVLSSVSLLRQHWQCPPNGRDATTPPSPKLHHIACCVQFGCHPGWSIQLLLELHWRQVCNGQWNPGAQHSRGRILWVDSAWFGTVEPRYGVSESRDHIIWAYAH